LVDLLQLRYFQTVARTQHITRAASELLVAQPSLSRAIARLEAELDVPLFDRTGRRIRLNRFGEILLARVDRALRELDEARLELADAAGEERGRVAVAAETLRAVTELVARFRSLAPQIELRLYQSTATIMAAQLRSGEVDLALASQELDGEDLERIDLFTEEVLLAVPPEHPLARRRRVTVAELVKEPFVVTRAGQWQRALLDQLLADVGRAPVIACEGDEPAAVRGLIAAGVGIGLLPTISRRTTQTPRVAWLHLGTDTARRTLRLYWQRERYLTAAARRFRDFADAQLRRGRGSHPD
jgi:DNA-binding transcriptional LysR family regulator